MIDTHCHLLAEIDDGARSELETIQMCRLACDDGIKTIVATPHSFDGKFLTKPETIRNLVTKLTEQLKSTGVDIEVLPGMEVRVGADLFEHLAQSEILPLNDDKYVLLEFHPSDVPAGFENFVKRLMESGHNVVLAHPEKNLAIQGAPEYVYRLLTLFKPWEILVQLTADSLSGSAGVHALNCSRTLLKHNLAHLIATDAHSVEGRTPCLSEAVKKAARIVGEDNALRMVQDIPRAVLTGTAFPEEWSPSNPRRWWRIF